MLLEDSQKTIERFLKEIRLTWQIVFLISLAAYGVSFLHHFNTQLPPRVISNYRVIDNISFVIAIGLALFILIRKRKFFNLRSLRLILQELDKRFPGSTEKELVRKLVLRLKKPILIIWLLGAAIVVTGVVFYWWTYQSRNMHIYFVVGLYSLMMNYPRKDLFLDLPYLAHELVRDREKKQ